MEATYENPYNAGNGPHLCSKVGSQGSKSSYRRILVLFLLISKFPKLRHFSLPARDFCLLSTVSFAPSWRNPGAIEKERDYKDKIPNCFRVTQKKKRQNSFKTRRTGSTECWLTPILTYFPKLTLPDWVIEQVLFKTLNFLHNLTHDVADTVAVGFKN